MNKNSLKVSVNNDDYSIIQKWAGSSWLLKANQDPGSQLCYSIHGGFATEELRCFVYKYISRDVN